MSGHEANTEGFLLGIIQPKYNQKEKIHNFILFACFFKGLQAADPESSDLQALDEQSNLYQQRFSGNYESFYCRN